MHNQHFRDEKTTDSHMKDRMAEDEGFAGYKWAGLSTFSEDSVWYNRAHSFFKRIKWDALAHYTSKLRDGSPCVVDPDIAMGGRHMIRILRFRDDSRWVARLRMTVIEVDDGDSVAELLVRREVDCIQLIRERTTVPVPKIFGYMSSSSNEIGAPFMLMECLSGNVAMDLKFDSIPTRYKSSFYSDMARYQTELSSLVFPKIGAITRSEDGTYDVGPLPKIGGPFDTVSDYLKAWAKEAEFAHSPNRIKELCGDLGDEVAASTAQFPQLLAQLSDEIPIRNNGPFPLAHVDFGHNNIIVDDNYKVLGVIDWEHAFAAPWETIDFPLTLSKVPKPVDAPWNYDENGMPIDEDSRKRIVERKEYVDAVRRAEEMCKLPPKLSSILDNERGQDLASAMRLFAVDGKMGFYSKVLDAFQQSDVVEDKGISGKL